jgi:hypothetical protein
MNFFVGEGLVPQVSIKQALCFNGLAKYNEINVKFPAHMGVNSKTLLKSVGTTIPPKAGSSLNLGDTTGFVPSQH